MRLGIVSTADINRKVIPGAHASDKVELVAVASREQRRAEEYAKTWEIPRAYGSYEALLEDPDLDAVYISLPNTMHREWSIRSLEAGKHVICEKPFSRRPEDVEEAFDAAERTGRLLTEAFMYRHNPQTAKLVELVREGAVGELRVVRSAFSYSLYDSGEHPPAHRRRRRQPHGRRLLLRERVTPPRRRAGGRLRPGVHRPERNRLGLHRRDAVPRGRARAVRLRDVPPGPRRARSDRDRGVAVPRRPVALPRRR